MDTNAYAIAYALVGGAAVVAAFSYWTYYALRNAKNPAALSPAEAWLVAKWKRRELDRLLSALEDDATESR